MRKLIIGIDPGITCGVAALTLDGKPIFIDSRRNWTMTNLLRTLTNLGEPVIISSDVSPAPELIERIAKNLNAIVFTPIIPLETIEKKHLARIYAETYRVKLENTHEVDALAAAIKAYNHFKNKFKQIEKRIKWLDVNVPVDDIKALMIRGYTIRRAINHLKEKPGETRVPPIRRREPSKESKLKDLINELNEKLALNKEEIKRLRDENKDLRRRITLLKREISDLKRRIREIREEETIKLMRERKYQEILGEVDALRRRLTESTRQLEEYKNKFTMLKRIRDLESKGEVTLLKPIEHFTEKGIEKASNLFDIKMGDIILLMDASGGGAATARTIIKRGIKAVIIKNQMSHQALDEFAKYEIPVIKADEVKIEWIEGLPYIQMKTLKEAIEKLREEERQQTICNLEDYIEEYRREIKSLSNRGG